MAATLLPDVELNEIGSEAIHSSQGISQRATGPFPSAHMPSNCQNMPEEVRVTLPGASGSGTGAPEFKAASRDLPLLPERCQQRFEQCPVGFPSAGYPLPQIQRLP